MGLGRGRAMSARPDGRSGTASATARRNSIAPSGCGFGLCDACSVAGAAAACSRSARRTRASASNEAGASALRLRFISPGLAQCVEVALGVECGHAASAGARDGLAVDVILHVAGGEHAFDVGGGGVALVAALGDDVAALQRELAFKDGGVGLVVDGDDYAGERDVLGRAVLGALDAHAGDAGLVAQLFVQRVVEFEADLAFLDLFHQV